MENQKPLDKIHELLEHLDFNELSEQEKELVLSVMSESEYCELRNMVLASSSFFDNEVPILPDDNIRVSLHQKLAEENILYKILNFPLPMYKVAASFGILLGLMFLFISQQSSKNQVQLALTDTVFVEKFDTITITSVDTVEVVKVVYLSKRQQEKTKTNSFPVNQIQKTETDFSMIQTRSICPDHIDQILKYSKSNSIKQDKYLASYIVRTD